MLQMESSDLIVIGGLGLLIVYVGLRWWFGEEEEPDDDDEWFG